MGDISTGELCNGRYKEATFLAIAMAVVLCTRRGVGGGTDHQLLPVLRGINAFITLKSMSAVRAG